SFVVGVFFTFLLYHAENNSHPHLKGCSRFEKISYCFFTIFSCFFRDLLYDPVTTFGRTLFGVWILISVFAVTVLSAIITSSVLYLMDKGSEILYHTNDLKNTNVAVLYGHPRLENMIEKAGANPVVFETINDAFDGLFTKKVEFMAIGKTNLSKFLEQNYSYAEEITTSKISLGYETWVLFGNEYYGQIIMNEPLLKYVNKNLNAYRNDFTMYNICERYIEHPELCVF
ncbi:MAG: transporter substrate-binding domain-containing protein, partial [Pseudomonadota bacterium]|nr:transporter substrate-binding domain-containing protein [Pseudomonadota bacterium]